MSGSPGTHHNSYKYLGVHLDKRLNFNKHITCVSESLEEEIGKIKMASEQ